MRRRRAIPATVRRRWRVARGSPRPARAEVRSRLSGAPRARRRCRAPSRLRRDRGRFRLAGRTSDRRFRTKLDRRSTCRRPSAHRTSRSVPRGILPSSARGRSRPREPASLYRSRDRPMYEKAQHAAVGRCADLMLAPHHPGRTCGRDPWPWAGLSFLPVQPRSSGGVSRGAPRCSGCDSG